MDISLNRDGKIRIVLDKEDFAALGLPEDTFKNSSEMSEELLAGLYAALIDTGIEPSKSGEISADVICRSDGKAIIYFTKSEDSNNDGFYFSSSSPKEITKACKFITSIKSCKIISDELYFSDNTYFLIIIAHLSEKVAGKLKTLFISDDITIEKIKEHGQLLTDTPIKKLSILPE